jgi:sigma-E factor negative regulatory protein RseA
MKQQISALMDGELFEDEAEALLDQLKRNPAAQGQWEIYHLISDALRQPEHLHADINIAMHERLQAEPTVLAPRGRPGRKAQAYALSAAASVMGLALVAWMSLQVSSDHAPQMAALQQPSPVQPASFSSGSAGFSANKKLNGYLMAHEEFSPSADVQGAASYIRTVAGQ